MKSNGLGNFIASHFEFAGFNTLKEYKNIYDPTRNMHKNKTLILAVCAEDDFICNINTLE